MTERQRHEMMEYRDPESGTHVVQLTNYRGHSNHAYFTHPNWLNDGRGICFLSDRENATQLCRIDLDSGAITTVCNLTALDPDGEGSPNRLHTDPQGTTACTWIGEKMYAIDLESGAGRRLFTVPDGFRRGMLSITADGRQVCFAMTEDPRKYYGSAALTRSERRDLLLREKPLSRICKVPLAGGAPDILHEERYLIGHVNTSPTRPELLTFCHEGPWARVDQRIWGLDWARGKAWPIRRRDPLLCPAIGHEYWLADGERVAFHGHPCPDPRSQNEGPTGTLGCIRIDNSEHIELRVPGPRATGHTHSLDFRRIVGDGGNVIQLWEYDGTDIHGPRLLCGHDTLTAQQRFHAHPVFSPDGTKILFSSVKTGYCQLYLADVPEDLAGLPMADTGLPVKR